MRDAGGLAPKTIRNLHVAVHAGLERAVKLQLIPRNPANFLDLPRTPRRHLLRLGIAEVQRFLEAAGDQRRRTGAGTCGCSY